MLKICQTFVDLFAAGGGHCVAKLIRAEAALLRHCTNSRFGEILRTIGPATMGAFNAVLLPLPHGSHYSHRSYVEPPFYHQEISLPRQSFCPLPTPFPFQQFHSQSSPSDMEAWGLRLLNNMLKLIHFVRNRL